jgi:hypothetical protein
VHPIEHLRYVARASHPDPCVLAEEAAFALLALANDANGLLVGCRLVIEYHPNNIALWWVCAKAVTSFEPRRTLRECLELLQEYTMRDEPASAAVPWGTSLSQLQSQYPDAVHLLKNVHTI